MNNNHQHEPAVPTPSRPCSSGILKRRYRSVLALNNMGVRLLENKCYAQAAETLRNANSLMGSLLLHGREKQASPDERATIQADSSGENFVHSAMKHLAEQKPAKKLVLLLEVLTATQDGKLATEGDPDSRDSSTNSCLHSVLQTAPSTFSAFPIRMDENLLAEDPTFLENGSVCSSPATHMAVVQQTSILAHNLAIATLCWSKTVTSASKSRKLLQSSLHCSGRAVSGIIKKNVSALQNLNASQGDTVDHNMDDRLVHVPCLLIALINSLIHILQESEQHTRARRFYAALARFRSMAFDLEQKSSDKGVYVTSPVAAAAA